MKIRVDVNGETQEAEVAPRTLLVHWLREELALTGTHIGCETSLCGACTVHVDGRAVKSCTMFAVQVDGRSVRTIESMGEADATGDLHASAEYRQHLAGVFVVRAVAAASERARE